MKLLMMKRLQRLEENDRSKLELREAKEQVTIEVNKLEQVVKVVREETCKDESN